MSERRLRASEIGEYSYCARAWWYRHVVRLEMPAGEVTGRLAAGRRAHTRHGRSVQRAGLLRTAAAVLALLGIMLLVAALVLAG